MRTKRIEEAHVQLRAKGELPRLHRAGPDHDFIQHRGDQPAVNDALETDMLRLRAKPRLNDVSVGLKPQFQA